MSLKEIKHFKIFLMVVVLLASFVFFTVSFWKLNRSFEEINISDAQLYTENIAGNIEKHMAEKFVVAEQFNNLESLKAFIENPIPKNLTQLNEDSRKLQIIEESDVLFFADLKSRNMYFWGETGFENVGKLDPHLPEDQWFYKTLVSKRKINLNVDVDRFINQMNVWLNFQLIDNNNVYGVSGMGLKLETFLSEIRTLENQKNAMTLIINDFGAIQVALDASSILENSFQPEVPHDKSLFSVHDDEEYRKDVFQYLNGKKSQVYKLKNGEYDYVAFHPILDTNWHLLSYYYKKTVSPINSWVHIAIILGVFLVILFVVILIQFKRKVESPLRNLKSKIYSLSLIDPPAQEDTWHQMLDWVDKAHLQLNEKNRMALFSMDESFQIIDANNIFLQTFLYEDLLAFNSTFQLTPYQLVASTEFLKFLKEMVRVPDDQFRVVAEFIRKDRERFWAELHFQRKGKILEGVMFPIDKKSLLDEKLLIIGKHDIVTGLLTKKAFIERMNEALEDVLADLSFIFFDFDSYKKVNEELGYDSGDHLIREIIQRLKNTLSEDDILARWDNDTFIVMLPHKDLPYATNIAERLRQEISHTSEKISITASFSVGPYLYGDVLSTVIERLEKHLEIAKNKGGNQMDVFQYNEMPMIHMPWQSQYESGDSIIDFEHKQLFEMAHRALKESFSKMNDSYQLNELKKIMQGIEIHFQNEEKILEQYHYPEMLLEEHSKKHRKLIIELLELYEEVKLKKIPLVNYYMYMIQEVIFNHMVEEDKLFFDFIKNNR